MKPLTTALIFSCILLVVYALSAPVVPSGFADSDEIITAGYFLSPAHPPGYGLQIILVHLAQKILFFTNPAHAANLLAALFHAASLFLIFQTLIHYLQHINKRLTTLKEQLIIAVGIAFTAFSTLFWLYGSVIEVMSLGSLFTAAILYQLINLITNKNSTRRQLILLSVTLGAGISHLQPLITLLPGIGLILLSHYLTHHPKQLINHTLISLTTIITTFFIISALILPLNARQQPYAWDFEPNISGFLSMVFRLDYQGEFADKNSFVENPYLGPIDSSFFTKISTYLAHIWNAYAGPTVLLSLFGMILFAKLQSNNISRIGVTLSWLVPTVLFGAYVTIINYDPYFLQHSLFSGVSHRQFVFSLPLLAFLSALAAVQLYQYIRRHLPQLKNLYLPALCVVLVAQINVNLPFVTGPQNRFVYDYANNLLESADEDAVIICASDFSCFSLYYASLIEKRRPDVTVLARNPKGRYYFLQKKNSDYTGHLYPINPLYYAQILTHNRALRPTYLTSFDKYFVDYIGFDGNPFYLIPQGNLFQVTADFPETFTSYQTPQITKQVAAYIPDSRHHLIIGFRDYLASNYQLQSQLFTRYGQTLTAATTLDTAITLHPFDDRVLDWRLRLEELSAQAAYTAPITKLSTETYQQEAQTALDKSDWINAEKLYRKALYISPNNPKILEQLITIYHRINDQRFLHLVEAHYQSLQTPHQ
jgi:hypothetical protein